MYTFSISGALRIGADVCAQRSLTAKANGIGPSKKRSIRLILPRFAAAGQYSGDRLVQLRSLVITLVAFVIGLSFVSLGEPVLLS